MKKIALFILCGLLVTAAAGCSAGKENTSVKSPDTVVPTSAVAQTESDTVLSSEDKSVLTSVYWYQKNTNSVTVMKFNPGGSVNYTVFSKDALNGYSDEPSATFFGTYSEENGKLKVINESTYKAAYYLYDKYNKCLNYEDGGENTSSVTKLYKYRSLSVENARQIW